MLSNTKRQILATYSIPDFSEVYLENFAITYISLSPLEKKNYFGNKTNGKFVENLEGKIVKKAWLEIPNLFPICKMGLFGIKENEFAGIITIVNDISREVSRKLVPVIISTFKSRSTKLLNQFHGTHGRVFWENTYRELRLESLDELNNVLQSIKTI